MTRDEVIRLAREAYLNLCAGDVVYTDIEHLERFAALVAAAEREACAKVCDKAYASALPADLANAIRARGNDETVG